MRSVIYCINVIMGFFFNTPSAGGSNTANELRELQAEDVNCKQCSVDLSLSFYLLAIMFVA